MLFDFLFRYLLWFCITYLSKLSELLISQYNHLYWNSYTRRYFLGHHWLLKEKRTLHWKLVRVTKYDKPPTCQVSIHSINIISVIDVLSFCPTILQHYAWHKRSIIMTSRVTEECKLCTSDDISKCYIYPIKLFKSSYTNLHFQKLWLAGYIYKI